VIGTAFDVWQIVRAFQDVGSVDEIVGQGTLTSARVQLALAYYEQNTEEIDAFIDRDRRSINELRAAYPSIETVQV